MCGIAGAVGGDALSVRRATRSLRHRGPDAEGFWSDPDRPVHLGHRRLAVIDLETGDQPMWTAEGDLGVVFNGEIYNHGALREELEGKGHRFQSDHADTEVLLHGYRAWGEALLERMNGMWAFALYDRRRRRLFLALDRFGKKPLYWSFREGVFVFASEASALLRHPSVGRETSTAGLRKYFAYGYVPAPHTIYRDVHKLPAGCTLTFDLGGEPRVRRWWEFVLEPEEPRGPDAARVLGEELRERLEAAVARRLVADVPVGVLLSGGIDSSSVAFAAARHTKPGGLRTFSIGFRDPSFDESAAARRSADLVGSRHAMLVFSEERAARVWPEVARRLDEPLADPSFLPTYVLCELARREVTVALAGDGADELFAGYDPFRALRWARAYARCVPRPLHRAIRLLASRLPVSHRNLSFDFKLKRTLAGLSYPPPLWNPVWMGPLEPREIAERLGGEVDPEELYAEAIEAWEGASARGLSVVDRTLQFFTRLYLQNDILVKVDRASMLHGLEVRAPFLDADLVDFLRRVPARFKLHGATTKWLLKRALESWLPREVRERPKKGFGIPVGRWLAEARVPFDAEPPAAMARRRLAEHRAGLADHRLHLYAEWVLDAVAQAGGVR